MYFNLVDKPFPFGSYHHSTLFLPLTFLDDDDDDGGMTGISMEKFPHSLLRILKGNPTLPSAKFHFVRLGIPFLGYSHEVDAIDF